MTSVTLHGVTDTLSGQDEKYASALETAVAAFKEVEQLLNDPAFVQKTGWKVDEEGDEGDIIYAKITPKGKMVSVSTELPLDADSVMNETWIGVDGLPEWNPNIKFARTLASPTSNFDIIHYGNNDVLIISGRDFVSARIYRNTSTGYIMASRSVRLKECPEQKGKVRAELILAGARFSPHPEKKDTTLVDVVMLADLKGLLPKFLVNQVLGKIMLMDTEENRRHFQRIRDRRDQERREEAVRDKRDVEDDMRERQNSETDVKDRKDQEVDKRDGRDVQTYARVVGDENADAREQDQEAVPRERQEEQAKE